MCFFICFVMLQIRIGTNKSSIFQAWTLDFVRVPNCLHGNLLRVPNLLYGVSALSTGSNTPLLNVGYTLTLHKKWEAK